MQMQNVQHGGYFLGGQKAPKGILCKFLGGERPNDGQDKFVIKVL